MSNRNVLEIQDVERALHEKFSSLRLRYEGRRKMMEVKYRYNTT